MNKTEHLLTCLAEECAELAKEACKANRFGLQDIDPHKPGSPNNAQKIAQESCDIVAIFELLEESGAIPRKMTIRDIEAKKAKVSQFMEYAIAKGTLKI